MKFQIKEIKQETVNHHKRYWIQNKNNSLLDLKKERQKN